MRDWPAEVVPHEKGLTRKFLAHYKRAFDADPGASFCAGEVDGITIVIARGGAGERLQHFVENDLDGLIQRRTSEPVA